MLSRYPCVRIAENTWEINEFDCASMFLLAGRERALLIDTGIGIGCLSDFVRTLTLLPVDVLLTHNHRDHVGGAPVFPRVHISREDSRMGPMLRPLTAPESRKQYAVNVRQRHSDRAYPWTDEDFPTFQREPEVVGIGDGWTFDLGGRTVVCRSTPGHTPGSLSAIDSQTGFLFCGDACNGVVGLGVRPIDGMRHATIEEALEALRRLWAMDFDHGHVFNGHADFRAPGNPLRPEVYPAVMETMEDILSGHYVSRPKYIQSIDAHVEIVTARGVELQFHRELIHGGNYQHFTAI